MKKNEIFTKSKYKEFLLIHVNRYKHFQKNIQEKYKNFKQNAIKKIKKYTEQFNLVFACFETSKRRDFKNKLQDFQKSFRNEYQIKLLEHKFYNNRKNLIETVMKLKNAEHR